MKKLIKKYFFPSHLQEANPNDEVYNFVLSYKGKEIGFLEFENKEWTFYYSDWFKSQDKIAPILEFPDKAIVYRSEDLWAFFISRIPSKINRETTFYRNSKDDPSLADLLKGFGRKTINNPFILETV